jgi:hypothetical protein
VPLALPVLQVCAAVWRRIDVAPVREVMMSGGLTPAIQLVATAPLSLAGGHGHIPDAAADGGGRLPKHP